MTSSELSSPGVQLLRSCGGNIISGHCTMAGPGWTTHRAQGQLRSTAPAPAPARDQNSFHKLSHHGEYLRLYLRLYLLYLGSVCCCCGGGLGGDIAATCVIIPANIPQPDTRQTALWWCSCGGQQPVETLNNLLILAPLSSTRLPAVQCSLLTRPHVHRITTIEYLSVQI